MTKKKDDENGTNLAHLLANNHNKLLNLTNVITP